MTTPDRRRTSAVVVRAGDSTAHLSIPAWMHGQITVRVPTADLIAATSLGRDELPGTELGITANLAAATDNDVDPQECQLPASRHLQAA